ncbi:MAG: hypothetical protein EP343_28005 [Deltaproteobacteria bacterium]|nr:MAG: hypothetical protein EP343_28005 [Deltaproteobacteria bacterium]
MLNLRIAGLLTLFACILLFSCCGPNEPCSASNDCSDGKVCKQGTCAPCESDGDCLSGSSCQEGACQENKNCKDANCKSGQYCKDNQCTEGCSKEEHCKTDETCDTAQNKCVSKNTCQSKKDCKDGLACIEEKCKPCESNDDCGASSLCKEKSCIPGCEEDKDCASGQSCINNKCGCSSAKDCPSSNYCSPAGACESCPGDEGCAVNELCINNVCRASACRTNKDCSTSEQNVCDSNKNKCVGCLKRSDCTQGKVCKNQQCESCQSDADCGDKTQACSNGGCVGKTCGRNAKLNAQGECECLAGYVKEGDACEVQCRPDQIRDSQTRGCTCATGQEDFKNQCVAVCTSPQVRNTTSGQCQCPTGTEEWKSNSQLFCRPLCRKDQQRDAQGKCVCPQGKEEYRSLCVDVCQGGMQRNPNSGTCECPAGEEFVTSLQKCLPKCRTDQTRDAKGSCGCKPTEIECLSLCRAKCDSHLQRDANCTCSCPQGYKDTGSLCQKICRSDQVTDGSGGCVCKPGFTDNGTQCVAGSCTAAGCATDQDCDLSQKKPCLKRCVGSKVWLENKLTQSGSCVTSAAFCQGKAVPNGALVTPYLVVKSSKTTSPNNEQAVCVTNTGFFYKPASQEYGECDVDGDGWINILAYSTYTELKQGGSNTPQHHWDNYRCIVHIASKVSYVRDYGERSPQVVDLTTPKETFFLVETARNDGRPTSQDPIPSYPGATGTAQFNPASINSLTKVCLNSNMDLNDNGILDMQETVLSTPPSNKDRVLDPHTRWSYYMELSYGYFQPTGTVQADKVQVGTYHIVERPRSKATRHLLGLQCEEPKPGNNHWKECLLKDDQACSYAANGTTVQPETYSECRPKSIRYKHALPSLFRCIQFKSQAQTPKPGDPYSPTLSRQNTFRTTTKGISDTSNRNKDTYSRTACKLDASLTNMPIGKQKDVNFSCSLLSQAPADGDVGWVCQSYKSYAKPSDYKGGCVQECTETIYQNNPSYVYSKAEPLKNLTSCPGNQKLGDRLCQTLTDNFGKGSCDYFYHYARFTSVGCTYSSTQSNQTCAAVSTPTAQPMNLCSIGKACGTDKDCPTGLSCKANRCFWKTCKTNTDCSQDTRCICPKGLNCTQDSTLKQCASTCLFDGGFTVEHTQPTNPTTGYFLLGGITAEGQ